MDCLAVYDSGNFAIKMGMYFKNKGLVFEVISLPCRISSRGCGYCMKFPEKYVDLVVKESKAQKHPVRELYRVTKERTKTNYEKMPLPNETD